MIWIDRCDDRQQRGNSGRDLYVCKNANKDWMDIQPSFCLITEITNTFSSLERNDSKLIWTSFGKAFIRFETSIKLFKCRVGEEDDIGILWHAYNATDVVRRKDAGERPLHPAGMDKYGSKEMVYVSKQPFIAQYYW